MNVKFTNVYDKTSRLEHLYRAIELSFDSHGDSGYIENIIGEVDNIKCFLGILVEQLYKQGMLNKESVEQYLSKYSCKAEIINEPLEK